VSLDGSDRGMSRRADRSPDDLIAQFLEAGSNSSAEKKISADELRPKHSPLSRHSRRQPTGDPGMSGKSGMF
jgi:hypothetical protein